MGKGRAPTSSELYLINHNKTTYFESLVRSMDFIIEDNGGVVPERFLDAYNEYLRRKNKQKKK